MLLTRLRFSSYKKFSRKEEMEIRPITVLVGKNSSGKSSITKLFPFLKRALSGAAINGPLSYNNDDVMLGGGYVDLSHNGYLTGLGLGVTFDNKLSIDMEIFSQDRSDALASTYTLTLNNDIYVLKMKSDADNYSCEILNKDYPVSGLSGFIHKELFNDIPLTDSLTQNIDYIGPLRVTPKPIFVHDSSAVIDHVGKEGENAYSMLFRSEELANKVSGWFMEAFKGVTFEVDKLPQPNNFRILFHKPYSKEYGINICNEGMGIGQVLPIVVRCFYPVKDSIVVVEQPELHLHPAAHDSLAKLFAQTAIDNNQRYIIETHSKNILLGIREAVVDEQCPLKPEDVIVYFVDEDESGAYLRVITIDSSGVLSDWPTGVWEESTEQLRKIRNLRKAF